MSYVALHSYSPAASYNGAQLLRSPLRTIEQLGFHLSFTRLTLTFVHDANLHDATEMRHSRAGRNNIML